MGVVVVELSDSKTTDRQTSFLRKKNVVKSSAIYIFFLFRNVVYLKNRGLE